MNPFSIHTFGKNKWQKDHLQNTHNKQVIEIFIKKSREVSRQKNQTEIWIF